RAHRSALLWRAQIGGDDRHRLTAIGVVGEDRPAGKHEETEAGYAGHQVRQLDRQREAPLLPGGLAERCAEIVRRHGSSLANRLRDLPARALRLPGNAAGRLLAAPMVFTARLTSGQFGTARLGSGGKAALVVAPRSRSTAIRSALSSLEL